MYFTSAGHLLCPETQLAAQPALEKGREMLTSTPLFVHLREPGSLETPACGLCLSLSQSACLSIHLSYIHTQTALKNPFLFVFFFLYIFSTFKIQNVPFLLFLGPFPFRSHVFGEEGGEKRCFGEMRGQAPGWGNM